MHAKRNRLVAILAFAAMIPAAQAATYALRLGEGQGEPGLPASVPVYLDSAADVAGIELQINYDPALLGAVGITNPAGSLGEAFGADWEAEDGRMIVRLFRMEGLASGSGLLCRVQFQVNPGAVPGMRCDLALADVGLSTQYGADLGWQNTLSRSNNRFWATFSATNDADGDGLSDYQEQMANGSADYDPGGSDTDIHLADTDGDGYDDRSELIAGTGAADGNDLLALAPEPDGAGFGRPIFSWRSATGRIYSVRFATNLLAWDAVPLLVVHGDGTDMAFTNALPLDSQLYYRLEVERE